MPTTLFVRGADLASLRRAGETLGIWRASLLRGGEWCSRASRVLGIDYHHPLVRARIRGYAQPVYTRLGSSDVHVLEQVFLQNEYAPIEMLSASPRTIVDCGANIGLASYYFLSKYPAARVIAVEPEPANLKICERNLAPFGERARLVRAGVWSHPTRLAVTGNGWTSSVSEAGSEEAGSVAAVDIPTLLQMTPSGTIDLLKIDIERSEKIVFGPSAGAWLPKVRNIVIELHDAECEAAFQTALRGYSFESSKLGDLTFCLNLRPDSEASSLP